MAKSSKMPKANIEWNKVPQNACIDDRRTHYVAHMPSGKKAVVFWDSRNAKRAQADLWARTQDGHNIRCMREIKAKESPLPGLSGRRKKRSR